MIVNRGTSMLTLAKRSWRAIALLVLLAIIVEALYRTVWAEWDRAPLPINISSVLITALTIFLAFRVGEAYGRWWEARQLWGKMVNLSRSFARSVLTLHWPEGIERGSVSRELIYRHIAYINALRIRLREAAAYADAKTYYAKWEKLLPEEDLPRYRSAKNVPAYLLLRQSETIAKGLGDSVSERLAWRELNGLLTELTDVQGGCERIKHTVFPDSVTYFTRALVWFLAPILLLTVLEEKSLIYDVLEVVVVMLTALVFVVIEQLGRDLKNPFENEPNDTPMSALCRTIEIDLRQHLGEDDLPEPLEPIKGVLM